MVSTPTDEAVLSRGDPGAVGHAPSPSCLAFKAGPEATFLRRELGHWGIDINELSGFASLAVVGRGFLACLLSWRGKGTKPNLIIGWGSQTRAILSIGWGGRSRAILTSEGGGQTQGDPHH